MVSLASRSDAQHGPNTLALEVCPHIVEAKNEEGHQHMVHADHVETAMLPPNMDLKGEYTGKDAPSNELVWKYFAGYEENGRKGEERNEVGQRAWAGHDMQSEVVIRGP